MSVQKSNFVFLGPLLVFTYVFCSFPQPSVKNSHETQRKVLIFFNRIFVFSCAVIWLILDGVAIFSQSYKLSEALMTTPQSILLPAEIMGLILQGVLAIFSLTIVISFGFVHSKGITNMFTVLDQIDAVIDFNIKKFRCQFYFNLMIFLFLPTVYEFYSLWFWKEMFQKPTVFSVYFLRIFQTFQTSLIVTTMNTLCYHLYQRLKRLHSLLLKFHPTSKYFSVLQLKKIRSLLCDQIDNVNTMFGLPLLCFIVTSITIVCYYVICIITSITYADIETFNDRLRLYIVCSIGIFFTTVSELCPKKNRIAIM